MNVGKSKVMRFSRYGNWSLLQVRLNGHLCLAIRAFFRTAALVDCHLESGGMPLSDAIGIICENSATTEHHSAAAWYLG